MGVGLFLAVYFPTALPFKEADSASITGLSIPSIGVTRQDEPILASAATNDTVRSDEFDDGLNALAGDSTATPEGQPEEAEAAGEVSALQGNYRLYAVQEGDTASSIAVANGISLDSLLAANPELQAGDSITVGQMLVIPNGEGVLYNVRYGETLSDVAAAYGVSIDEILNWPANGISSPDDIVDGQLIFIPGASAPVSVAAPEPTATEPPVVVEAPFEPAPVGAFEPPPVSEPAPSYGLVWPVYGPVSSYMDGSHPLGIDIDLFNNPGAAIVAATSGTVIFAGGDPCCSYGYHVIIMSPDGIETLYAHFSGIAVSTGQVVSQGEVIGYGGCTGYCTGSHLHFEVIDNGYRADPLAYLP